MGELFLDCLFLFPLIDRFSPSPHRICHKGRLIYRYSKTKEDFSALFVVLGELETLANSDFVRCNGPSEADQEVVGR